MCPVASDASHTSLTWIENCSALAGATLGPTSCRAALRVVDLHLLVIDSHDQTLADLALGGQTLDEALAWLGTEIARARGGPRIDLVRPEHDLPDHAVGHGRSFVVQRSSGYEELARWYADAWRILEALAASMVEASPARVWPHHLDAASLIALGDTGAPESSKSIGFGMSPGDASYAEPYWYVSPWPYPTEPTVRALEGGGTWHRQGWFGAVLTASSLASPDLLEGQARQVEAFFRSAIGTCRQLLAERTKT